MRAPLPKMCDSWPQLPHTNQLMFSTMPAPRGQGGGSGRRVTPHKAFMPHLVMPASSPIRACMKPSLARCATPAQLPRTQDRHVHFAEHGAAAARVQQRNVLHGGMGIARAIWVYGAGGVRFSSWPQSQPHRVRTHCMPLLVQRGTAAGATSARCCLPVVWSQ